MSKLEYRNLKEKDEQAIKQLKRSLGAKIAKINTEMKVIEEELNRKNIENSSLQNNAAELEDSKSQMENDLDSLRIKLGQTEKKYLNVQYELQLKVEAEQKAKNMSKVINVLEEQQKAAEDAHYAELQKYRIDSAAQNQKIQILEKNILLEKEIAKNRLSKVKSKQDQANALHQDEK